MSDASKGVGTPSNDEREPEPQPVGDAVGGIVGTAAGAGIGAMAGPLGVIMGALAGALGGWWAGATAAEALQHFDEEATRKRHEMQGDSTREYESVRDLYRFGYLAGRHPDNEARDFAEVEPELRRTWVRHSDELGEWEQSREYIEEGYRRRS